MSDSHLTLAGKQVVIRLYLVVVAITGLMGLVLGTISPVDLEPELFGIIPLPPTALGVAVYGIVTVGLLLGVLLGLVVFISDRYDDAGP